MPEFRESNTCTCGSKFSCDQIILLMVSLLGTSESSESEELSILNLSIFFLPLMFLFILFSISESLLEL